MDKISEFRKVTIGNDYVHGNKGNITFITIKYSLKIVFINIYINSVN